MQMDEVVAFLEAMPGILVLAPKAGDGSPELAWGDSFFYFSPSGEVPLREQPFATIVTKTYPGEKASRLDRPGAFRVNVKASKDDFTRFTGHQPRDTPPPAEHEDDTVVAHPTYGTVGWLAVVNPGEVSRTDLFALLEAAYEKAVAHAAK
ncbi:DUF6194 family protein [Smaragdicoccus niigatensis]|uniref:DUF6194 family protein n=1 Tax=Smaragdicoccus niigatensis TaxID=359359 RepID=UPI000368F383|nr:DUF6194 family protein [Smaragdicoccus niigatensis]